MWEGESSTHSSLPVAAFATHGALVIGTDGGDWFSLGPGDRFTPLASSGPASAMVCDASGTVTVAPWQPALRQLRDGAWSTIALTSPVIALAVTPRGLVLADATGGLALMASSSRAPVQELAAEAPVVALAPAGHGLVALLAGGAVAVTRWPAPEAPPVLTVLDTASIGRAHAVFAGAFDGAVLVAGARGLGLIEHGRLIANPGDLGGDAGDRLAGAAPLPSGRALVHGDGGDAWIMDRRLNRVVRVAISGVTGCAAGAEGRALAWTGHGALYAVASDGAHRLLTSGSVVLAAPEVGRIGALAIHWTPERGVRSTRGHTWT
jgi:hypothetical protein